MPGLRRPTEAQSRRFVLLPAGSPPLLILGDEIDREAPRRRPPGSGAANGSSRLAADRQPAVRWIIDDHLG